MTDRMSDLPAAIDALAAVATRAGVSAERARDEGLVLAAAVAESAPGAAADWCAAAGRELPSASSQAVAAANSAFFDAASRGRRWRQSPTALLSELVASDPSLAADYAQALTEVASAACTLGEPTMRVTGNASVAAAAQLEAVGRAPHPLAALDPASLLGQLAAGAVQGGPPHTPAGSPAAATDSGLTPEDAAAPDNLARAKDSFIGSPDKAEAAGPPEKSLEELMGDLDAMIGLGHVKDEVHQQVAILKVEQKRAKAGLKNPDVTRHLVFTGNPGTGKTTIARMVGGIYRALGLLAKGQLVEVDRSELVAGYLGQTAIKTAEQCAKAYGGVLFIDEAYALSGDQYGEESINTLVKEMEDHRDELVVIVAGYTDPMARFIAENPGLASRFKTTIEFEDYSDEELLGILEHLAASSDFDLADDAVARVRSILTATPRGPMFGNGRFARNLLEDAIGRHAMRLQDIDEPTLEQLRRLAADDFGPAPSPLVLPHDQPVAAQPDTEAPGSETSEPSGEDAPADERETRV